MYICVYMHMLGSPIRQSSLGFLERDLKGIWSYWRSMLGSGLGCWVESLYGFNRNKTLSKRRPDYGTRGIVPCATQVKSATAQS